MKDASRNFANFEFLKMMWTPSSVVLIAVTVLFEITSAAIEDDGSNMVCVRAVPGQLKPLARRYDISDMGYKEMFHGWVDVQGQGAANDYCRFVGTETNIFLSCALAGTHGESEHNYRSQAADFDRGYPLTWYMKDEDGDMRDDYCRCSGKGESQQVVCTKAGPKGFHGSAEQGGRTYTFTPTGSLACEKREVRPEFGRVYGFVI